MLEALFALCRKAVENEPLKIFMAISDLDRNRAKPLDAATVDRLARELSQLRQPVRRCSANRASLSDKSIVQFLDTADSHHQDPAIRCCASDLAGTFQALVGLWQIFVRQQSIPDAKADAPSPASSAASPQVKNERELFDAGRNGVEAAAGRAPRPTAADSARRTAARSAGRRVRRRDPRYARRRWCRT